MKHVVRTLAASALIAAAPPAPAQDKPPRDSAGTIMDLSRWHPMPTHEFMLNIVDLPNADFTRAQRRVRDKGIPHERVWFDGGNGFIFVEHAFFRVFTEHSTARMEDRDYVDGLLDRFGQRRSQVFEAEQRRKIYTFGERGGWVYAIRGKRSGETCVMARFGILSDWGKLGHLTGERYDTGVNFRDCSGKRSFEDVVKWVEGAKIVEPPYNRVR